MRIFVENLNLNLKIQNFFTVSNLMHVKKLPFFRPSEDHNSTGNTIRY